MSPNLTDDSYECAPLEQPHAERGSGTGRLPLSTLRKKFADMPDVEYAEFLELKKIWEPRIPDDLPED